MGVGSQEMRAPGLAAATGAEATPALWQRERGAEAGPRMQMLGGGAGVYL